jgi:hypothetical protein
MASANHVGWFEITGKDAAKSQQFYRDLFGWPVDSDNPNNYGMVQGDQFPIGGGIAGSIDGKPLVTVYVDVDDLQATLDRAKSLGGDVVMPPMAVQEGLQIAQFKDIDGNVIGIMKGMG